MARTAKSAAAHGAVRSGDVHSGQVAVRAPLPAKAQAEDRSEKTVAKAPRKRPSRAKKAVALAAAQKAAKAAAKPVATAANAAAPAKRSHKAKPKAAPAAPNVAAQARAAGAAAPQATAAAPAALPRPSASRPSRAVHALVGADEHPSGQPTNIGPVTKIKSSSMAAPPQAAKSERMSALSAASTAAAMGELSSQGQTPAEPNPVGASNEDKLAHALATRPVHEAVDILAEAGLGAPAGTQVEGQSRTFRDDPSLDRRIIEGMLDDKDSFLDNMHRQGFGRDAVVRRAAELGLSEALIRQVKGVAADLAGERPGRRPTPSSLGARTCLSCDRVFFSSGPGNRLCTRCRGGDAGLAQL